MQLGLRLSLLELYSGGSMQIHEDVLVKGEREEIVVRALIDTGAEISIIPHSLASRIGAWSTSQAVNVAGVHGQARTFPLVVSYIYFPSLKNVGGQLTLAMSNGDELIVGMDILSPLGITIDTRTHELSVKNEIWEAFKALSAIGVIFFAGVKIVEVLSEGHSVKKPD